MQVTSMPTFVEQGALLLDHRKPSWARLINVNDLDMSDPRRCILGQIYGHAEAGLRALGFVPIYSPEAFQLEIVHGFNVHHTWHPDDPERWDILTALWRKEIKSRIGR
jgi:hypothetical protein